MNNLKNKSILISGGAGFIGSNIVDHLVKEGYQKITVLDNLATGSLNNIEEHIANRKIDFIKGDITNIEDCLKATLNIDIVLHQAALGSVPRSIQDPLATHAANVTGFVNMLEASRQNKISRFVYASSSSVYGNDPSMPKIEDVVGEPLSPYAVSKKTNELYAKVFASVYKMEIIGLRYFNVFGPKQNPKGPYAAVIPIFINNLLNKKKCYIYGDGNNRRDFTYIDNVVEANILAASTKNAKAFNQVFNIAYGDTQSVNSLFEHIKMGIGSADTPEYLPSRKGEIKDSFASVEKAKDLLNYRPLVNLNKGIELTIDWYKSNSFK
ncbi:MAG: SDR family oxidoreductase [Bacteroidetes bacterium]|nr:SDR family oxidoreductase [Bacteroidota bacterium]